MSRTDSDVEDLPFDYSFGEECEEEGDFYGDYEYEQTVYHSEDYISTSYFSDKCTLKSDILEFDFSYGYDCKRHFNLLVADEQTLVFASGNFINFFNTETKEIWFRRSSLGGGIGHLTTNPNPEYFHITIAENGPNPPIIIYNWPTLDIVTILKGGAAKIYSHIAYNPNGSLLVSQSGDPDYLITVWNWPKSRILLRTKSYSNDVYKVMFSPSVPGHLTSCGVAHIKFWKMARTFTGLKLQGELGRFGKTEYSDILGIYPMPDEKVISGCYWGNFLIWDEGLIKLEVFRKLRKNCHDGPIVQFDYKNGELWTVSMDGKVKVWTYEPIDQADPPDDDRIVQIEPIYEFHTPGVEFMYILKQNDDETNTFYYAQDGNGGLWKIDLNTDGEVQPSEQLYVCHAGEVVDIAACPWGNFLASLGKDGRLYIYNYITRKLIFTHQFPAKGCAMIWLPITVQNSGDQIIMGFDDGNLRSIGLVIDEGVDYVKLFLLQVTKPHNKPITQMSLNPSGNILVTSGEDKTLFIFQVLPLDNEHTTLVPIGYVFVPDIATCITWHMSQPTTVILGCLHGQLYQVQVPSDPQDYTTITYILYLEPIENTFTTYKAQIRRDIKIREIEAKKEAKRERKRREMKKILAENPGMTIDEDIFLADSESTESLTPLFIPEVPNKVLWIQSMKNDTLWLSMGGYDAGYVYEYKIDQKSTIPQRFQMVYEADDTEISSYLYNYNRKYLIMAMEDGSIRVNKVKKDYMDLEDYWKISMHDNLNGFVPRMSFSYNEKYFFSCGHDGNVFAYQFFPEHNDYIKEYPKRAKIFEAFEYVTVPDVTDYKTLSLEEAIVKKEKDRVEALANKRKAELRAILHEMGSEFLDLIERNEKLLPTQVIPKNFFRLDPRITEHLQSRMKDNLDLVKRKLEFKVHKSKLGMQKLMEHFIDPLDVFPIRVNAFQSGLWVRTIRQRKLAPEFEEMQKLVEKKLIEAELKGRPPERPQQVTKSITKKVTKEGGLEYFLLGLSPSTIKFKMGAKLTRLLIKYRERKARKQRRKEEWEEFNKIKPIPGVNHPDDEAALLEAIKTIGDYKLKTALDYKIPAALRDTRVKKYKELLECRQKQYNLRHDFNNKVYELREQKIKYIADLSKLNTRLEYIHSELPDVKQKEGPEMPKVLDEDFPENSIKVHVEFPQRSPSNISVKNMKFPISIQPLDDDSFEYNMLTNNGERFSAWELEAKQLRLTRKVFEQDQIILKMNEIINQYDKKLQDLTVERLFVSVDADFIDLHLLKLHQELIILKDFEAGEDILQDKVNEKMEDLLDLQQSINDTDHQIKTYEQDILDLQDQEKKIQTEFFNAINENKFYDFLRKIFKKKYRPPRIRDPDDEDDESSSESSDDSEDEEDEGSIDSRDFGIIKLDESVCPKGCDQALYDLTYSLRGQRHQVELKIRETTESIEKLKKDIESIGKKFRLVESLVQTAQNDLEMYQREKQKRLNQVMTTVVLKLNQVQNLLKDKDFAMNKISDSLIFSQASLTKLYKRVGQLQMESIEQRAKHKINITHLSRMQNDCKYMSKDIASLKKEIQEAMIMKFGSIVDIDEVLEANLKKLVFYLRMSQTDIRSLYEHELRVWRNRYERKQIELAETIRENTERLELLTLLNKEKAELAHVIHHQGQKRAHLENVVDVAEVYKKDIAKLSEIVQNQYKEIQTLKNETLTLRTKGLSLKDLELPDLSHPEEIVEEEDDGLDWGGTFEEYLEQNWEYYAMQEEQRQREEEEARSKLRVLLQKPADHIPIVKKFIPKSPEEIAYEIISEMVDEIDQSAVRIKVESIINFLVDSALKSDGIREIIEMLVDSLPLEDADRHMGIIETTAERLYAVRRSDDLTEDEVMAVAKDILEEIVEASICSQGHTICMITELVCNLVCELPFEYIYKPEIIDIILSRLTDNLSFIEVDKDELAESLTSLTGPLADDVKSIMNIILERVFGIGIDYLYILNEQFKRDQDDELAKTKVTIPVKEAEARIEESEGNGDEESEK